MKIALVLAGWFLAASAFAQQVAFTNGRIFDTPADRLVYMPDGTGVVGSDVTQPPTFVAQLYYGTTGVPEDTLQAVPVAPARFRPATTGPGVWLGGNRTLWGF